MIPLTDIQELAAPLVDAAALIEVRLFESHAQHVEFPSHSGAIEASDIDVSVQSGSDDSTGMFVLRAESDMREVIENQEPRTVATFAVAFGALYSFDDKLQDEDGPALEAFGKCVATLTLWPYVRAEMSRLVDQMHLSASLTLPMLTQRDFIDKIN